MEVSNSLIIYIHGGGFIAKTSLGHEIYLREISSSVEVPIVSIDYSIAPESPYPRAIDEVFFAYCWILQNGVFCGSNLKNVIVISESAGSSIFMSCIIKCIQNSIRLPDRSIVVYGVITADSTVSPSRLLGIIDPILPLNLMLILLSSYHQENSPFKDNKIQEKVLKDKIKTSKDQFISLLKASDDILMKFPATTFMCPTIDPMLDDSIELAKRLDRLGVDVTVKILKGLSHSYNNFANVRFLNFRIIHELLITYYINFQLSEDCHKGLLVCIEETRKACKL
jgi:acetyl esterase/lipase